MSAECVHACAVRWLERRATYHQNFVKANHILCDVWHNKFDDA